MKKRLQRLSFFALFFLTIIACAGLVTNLLALPARSASANLALAETGSPSPSPLPSQTRTVVVANDLPTPTPFQPIPPTPIITLEDVPSPTPILEATPTATLVPDESAEKELDKAAGTVNILLLGADARPWAKNFRTDTIMLLTLNPELGRVNITSFPRDLYVTVPGWGMQRINSAWTYGKFKLLRSTFQHNFGIRPDYYAVLRFSSFKQIIDSLGGLDIHVKKKLSDYRAGYWVTIPAGEVHMDADDVLWYVRSRKTTNDFARNQRQQEVLQALFKKLISMNGLRRVPELYDHYQSGFITNIELIDLLTWLPVAARVAENPDNIHYYAVKSGQVSNYITPYGAMVLLPNRQKVMNTVRKSQNLE